MHVQMGSGSTQDVIDLQGVAESLHVAVLNNCEFTWPCLVLWIYYMYRYIMVLCRPVED